MQANQYSQIRCINFWHDSLKVAQLIKESFQDVFVAEGIDFDRYIKLAKKSYVRLVFHLLHPLLCRFGEAFVWFEDEKLMGTGIVQRIRFIDKKKWVLRAFAIHTQKPMGFRDMVKMRSLMRKAIEHASQNGAYEIHAYIRRDNRTPYILCTKEGFKEIEDYRDQRNIPESRKRRLLVLTIEKEPSQKIPK